MSLIDIGKSQHSVLNFEKKHRFEFKNILKKMMY